MDIKQLKEVLEIFEESSLSKMELEVSDMKIKFEKNSFQEGINIQTITAKSIEQVSVKQEEKQQPLGSWVTAPLVGTYYAARSETDLPFVEVGKRVKKGDILCIIEAMKVMNEIQAPCSGVLLEIAGINGNLVDYDQNLILIGE